MSSLLGKGHIIRDAGISFGTWFPRLEGTTTQGVNTYATKKGTYYNVGKLVKLTFLISMAAKDAATAGNMRITGLPFPAGSDERVGVSFSYTSNVTLTSTYTGLLGNLTTDRIYLYQVGSNISPIELPVSAINNVTALWGSVTYESA